MPNKKLKTQMSTVNPERSRRIDGERSRTIKTAKGNLLSAPVYSLAGVAAGKLELPKEIFGKKINLHLLSQAVRVYLTNQKEFTAKTRTRGEVTGSTVKIFRQKGTGRARHGAIRAPIFVGGGIVFGPQPRKVRLAMPQKMKKAALLQALSQKALEGKIFGLTSLDQVSGKTQQIATFLKKVGKNNQFNSALIVTEKVSDNVTRAVRNIPGVSVLPVNLLNAYQVLRHEALFIVKDTLKALETKEKEVKKA